MFPRQTLDFVILSLMDDFPDGITGYALVEEFKKRFGGAHALSPGTLYPRLTKLKAENFIEDDGKVWKITEEGKRRLEMNVPDVLAKSFDFARMLKGVLAKGFEFAKNFESWNAEPNLFDAESIARDLDQLPDEGRSIQHLDELKDHLTRVKASILKQVESIDTLLMTIDEKLQRCNEEKVSWKRIPVEDGRFDEH